MHLRTDRIGYALAGVASFVLAVWLVRNGDARWWFLLVFGIGPDLALLIGMQNMRHGRISPAAVPLYNATHHFVGPMVVGVVALFLSTSLVVGALAWIGHICFDRCLGFGLRAPDGSMLEDVSIRVVPAGTKAG